MKRSFRHLVFAVSAIATLAAVPALQMAPAQANFVQAGANLLKKLATPEVKLNLAAHKKLVQTDKQGKPQISWQDLGSKAVVQPGDVLRYSLSSSNIGDAAAKNLVLNQPIPAQMTYVLNSARSNAGLRVTYSIDNGRTFVAQPKVKVKQADGSIVEKPAPAEIYTHVRWQAQGDVAPATNLMASYEVKVR
ncbi:MAG: DUF11 domain-containing protein [Synechococcales cyanobacterium RM1_1_8]|nr:DUF11 domain-containing protein [Synechococcales cyanobacterium RM1_1_8]